GRERHVLPEMVACILRSGFHKPVLENNGILREKPHCRRAVAVRQRGVEGVHDGEDGLLVVRRGGRLGTDGSCLRNGGKPREHGEGDLYARPPAVRSAAQLANCVRRSQPGSDARNRGSGILWITHPTHWKLQQPAGAVDGTGNGAATASDRIQSKTRYL